MAADPEQGKKLKDVGRRGRGWMLFHLWWLKHGMPQQDRPSGAHRRYTKNCSRKGYIYRFDR